MEKTSALSFNNTEIAFAHQSDAALKKARFIFSLIHNRWLVKIGAVLAPWALRIGLPVKGLIRNTIFEYFCGGESLQEAGHTARRLAQFRVGVILDYGVEAAEGEDNYDHTVAEFEKAIIYASRQSNIPFVSLKVTGFARFSLLEKLNAGENLIPEEQEEYERVRQRIYTVCRLASQRNIGVLVDAEESWIQSPIDHLADEMMAEFNKEQVIVYNTFQLYRQDRLLFLQRSFERACEKHYLLGAKLVRGAYMEKERDHAAKMGYPSPIQPEKSATDQDYDQAVCFCIEHLDRIAVFIGTHNEASCLLGACLLQEKKIPHDHPHVHFSQLYGMSDNITFNLAAAGYRVSKYVPYGPVRDVMPYLIRRAQENSSIAGQAGREQQLIRQELRRRHL
jgi:proline dehydrogenase